MKTFFSRVSLLLASALAAFGSMLTVTNNADSGSGSLRDAIANAASGDTITFALALPNTISLTSGELLIERNLTITGPGADLLTVERNSGSLDLGLPVLHIAAGDFDVAISGLTVAKGLSGGAISSGKGGGLDNQSSGTVAVSSCTFSDNFAGFEGGGVANEGQGTLIVTDCVLTGNTSNGGGGGLSNPSGGGTVTVLRCTISFNTTRERVEFGMPITPP